MTTEDKPHLILRPKKSPAIWLLLGCGTFVAGGLWMAQENGWIGYLCAGFFALGIPVAVVQLLPGSTYLRIADDGLSFANMFRVTTIPWNVIDQFFVVGVKQTGMTVHKMVAFNFVPSYDRARLGRRVNSAIAKCEGALPDTCGQKAEELAEILNRCLAQFKEGHGEQSGEPEPPITRDLKS
jgi:hypothetical protein